MIVEDEKHFLMQCPAYSSQRTTMMNKLTQFPNFEHFDESEQFVWMMSQNDSESIKCVGHFIFSSIKTQENTRTTAPYE